MILNDVSIIENVIKENEMKDAIDWWSKRDWDKIKGRILIDPLRIEENLGTCSYDLSVGGEYVSLRDPKKVVEINSSGTFLVRPGETVLILSDEYIGLPRNKMALVVPRARWIAEGTIVNATRVDPTWHGKLLVGFTNQTNNPIQMERGKSFCTCLFMQLDKDISNDRVLTKQKTDTLGRTRIGVLSFQSAIPERLMQADRVTAKDLDAVVDEYGKPFDIIRGGFECTRKEIMDYCEKDLSANIIVDSTNQSYERAFGELMKAYRNQQKLMWALVITVIGAIITTVITYILYSAHLIG